MVGKTIRLAYLPELFNVSRVMAKGKENAFMQPIPGPDPDLIEIIDIDDAPYPEQITFEFPEFSSLCPITGQPDSALMHIHYTPVEQCLEETSLQRYLGSFRNHGGFNEAIVNQILNDLVAACAPREMTVRGEFAPRGGIQLTVEVSHPA